MATLPSIHGYSRDHLFHPAVGDLFERVGRPSVLSQMPNRIQSHQHIPFPAMEIIGGRATFQIQGDMGGYVHVLFKKGLCFKFHISSTMWANRSHSARIDRQEKLTFPRAFGCRPRKSFSHRSDAHVSRQPTARHIHSDDSGVGGNNRLNLCRLATECL